MIDSQANGSGQASHNDPTPRFISLTERLKNRGRDYSKLMLCPHDNTALHIEGEQLVCQDGHHYYSRNGIIYLLSDELRQSFDAQAEITMTQRQAEGWPILAEDEFKRLPQTTPSGYPPSYWDKRAFATAELWRFLEDVRREAELPPIGHMGYAVEFTGDMGWLGYGLDVSGYGTIIVGQSATPMGLGAYNYGRYPRIQASVAHPPLVAGQFDLVLYTYCLSQVEDLQTCFHHGQRLLKPGGYVVVMLDESEATQIDTIESALTSAHLAVYRHAVGGMGNRLQKLSTTLRGGPGVPPLLICQKHR
jgi:hypothetical protein